MRDPEPPRAIAPFPGEKLARRRAAIAIAAGLLAALAGVATAALRLSPVPSARGAGLAEREDAVLGDILDPE